MSTAPASPLPHIGDIDNASSGTCYNVEALLSEVEAMVIQRLRAIAAEGYGELHITWFGGAMVGCKRVYTENPAELRRLQEEARAGKKIAPGS